MDQPKSDHNPLFQRINLQKSLDRPAWFLTQSHTAPVWCAHSNWTIIVISVPVGQLKLPPPPNSFSRSKQKKDEPKDHCDRPARVNKALKIKVWIELDFKIWSSKERHSKLKLNIQFSQCFNKLLQKLNFVLKTKRNSTRLDLSCMQILHRVLQLLAKDLMELSCEKGRKK